MGLNLGLLQYELQYQLKQAIKGQTFISECKL